MVVPSERRFSLPARHRQRPRGRGRPLYQSQEAAWVPDFMRGTKQQLKEIEGSKSSIEPTAGEPDVLYPCCPQNSENLSRLCWKPPKSNQYQERSRRFVSAENLLTFARGKRLIERLLQTVSDCLVGPQPATTQPCSSRATDLLLFPYADTQPHSPLSPITRPRQQCCQPPFSRRE